MKRSYFNPVKIIMERGALNAIPDILDGKTALLITTPGMIKRPQARKLLGICGENITATNTGVIPNPTISSVTECYQASKNSRFDVIIAMGGGSALDTAKGVAMLACGRLSDNWLNDYFRNKAEFPENPKPKPIIAIPTTAGTGSEVTKWATIWDELSGAKYSLSNESLYPEWAVLDPETTDSLPYETTLFTSLDAFSHAMESIWNNNNNPVSDMLAAKAITIWKETIDNNYSQNYSSMDSRENMLSASLFAGLAFSNTQTALAHSISYPLTSRFNIPHGLACSFTLPEIMKYNYKSGPARIDSIIKALSCSTVEEAVDSIYRIYKLTNVSTYLRHYFSGADISKSLSDMKFVIPERAGNNLAPVSNDNAFSIIKTALSNILPDIQL